LVVKTLENADERNGTRTVPWSSKPWKTQMSFAGHAPLFGLKAWKKQIYPYIQKRFYQQS
jgi:hypothetical protein